MNADGFALMEKLNNNPGLAAEINRCAYYARLDRKVNEIYLASLETAPKMTTETLTVRLLTRILDELT